jgi:hypothetical protein
MSPKIPHGDAGPGYGERDPEAYRRTIDQASERLLGKSALSSNPELSEIQRTITDLEARGVEDVYRAIEEE